MNFKSLPPGLAALMIQGSTDELSAAAETRRQQIPKQCPRCAGNMESVMMADFIYTPDDPLPRSLAKCADCGYTMDPKTGILIAMGNPAKAESSIPIIRPDDD